MKSGVIKRLWLVLSVPWTVLMVLLWPDAASPNAILLFMVLPWIVGPVLFLATRYIIYGRVAKHDEPITVEAEWAEDD